MKQFTTALAIAEADELKNAEERDEEQPDLEFEIDGTLIKAFKPGDGQFGMFMLMTSKRATTEESVAGVIDFFLSMLDDESQNYVYRRLMDRRDSFGIEKVRDIMMWMVEEWSGNPTHGPSGSTSSQPSTGPSSTPTTSALI